MTQPKDPIAGVRAALEMFKQVAITNNGFGGIKIADECISLIPTIQANYLPLDELPEGWHLWSIIYASYDDDTEGYECCLQHMISGSMKSGGTVRTVNGQGPTPNAAFMDACGKAKEGK